MSESSPETVPGQGRPNQETHQWSAWIDIPSLQILCKHASGVLVALLLFWVIGLCLKWTLRDGVLREMVVVVDEFVLVGLLLWFAFQMAQHFWRGRLRK